MSGGNDAETFGAVVRLPEARFVSQADGPGIYEIKAVCPCCGALVVLERLAAQQLDFETHYVNSGNSRLGLVFGIRRCPDVRCRGLVFFVQKRTASGHPVHTYPSPTMKMNLEGVPAPVAQSVREAVRCEAAGCFTAAAIMVRRSVEDICKDRGARGRTLFDRIDALKDCVTLPTEMIEATHDLRLLGNDAAHVDTFVFAEVGQDEVSVGLAFVQMLLHSIYQYKDVIERLRSLKVKPPENGADNAK